MSFFALCPGCCFWVYVAEKFLHLHMGNERVYWSITIWIVIADTQKESRFLPMGKKTKSAGYTAKGLLRYNGLEVYS